MAVNNVNYNDTLREGTDKINQSIDQSNQAIDTANDAITVANDANVKSSDTQQQLDNIVINNGESDAEVLQARGYYSLLKDRFEQLERNVVSITDKRFGGIVDGVTNDTLAFNAAQDYLVSVGGGKLLIPSGTCLLNPIVVKKGVYVIGAGTSLIFDYMNGIKTGTVLLINGQAGDECVTFEEEKNVMGMKDLSVYNNTANAIHSVMRIKGNSFVQLRDIEISGTQVCDGTGLFVDPYIGVRTNGAHYNYHYNVSVVGNYLKYGIWFQGYDDYEGANSNIFYGGRVNGWFKSLVMTGNTVSNTTVNNLVFNDITFEHVFNPNSPIGFVSDTKNVLAYNSPFYGVTFIDIAAGRQNLFKGCRFEHGNTPTSHNDGTNGTYPVLGLISLANGSLTRNNQFLGNAYFNTYFRDEGHQTLVNSEKSGLNLIPSTKPNLLAEKTTSQNVSTGTLTTVIFNTLSNNEVLYSNGVITFKQGGVYQLNAQILYNSFTVDGWSTLSVKYNSTTNYFTGDYARSVPYSSTFRCSPSISLMIRVNRGDTIEIQAYHETGVVQSIAGFRSSSWLQLYKL
jgi:hypothetical protein